MHHESTCAFHIRARYSRQVRRQNSTSLLKDRMEDLKDAKPHGLRWTEAERWQVFLAAAGLVVAIIAAVGQLVQ